MEDQNKRRIRYLMATGLLFLVLIGLMLTLRPAKQPSVQDQQLAAQQRALASSAYADPILKYLPYGDIGYNINPTLKTINSRHVLTLVISITLTDADYRSTHAKLQTTIKAREQNALNYIRSKGFDPSKYRIEYSIPSD